MDLYDWFFKQVVSPGELSEAFEAAERSIQSMVTTLGIHGLAVGGAVVQVAPTPGLNARVSGPLIAYDEDGNRIYLAAASTLVDLSVDENNAATAIFTPGQERYLAIFVKFERELSEPRTDGFGADLMFARKEAASIVVAAGAPAPAGAASRAALRPGHILLADVKLITGQSQVLDAHIFTDRTQYLFRAAYGLVSIWGRTFPEIVQKLVQKLAEFITELNADFDEFKTEVNGQITYVLSQIRTAASQISFTPFGDITADDVQEAIQQVRAVIPGAATIPTAAQVSFEPAAGLTSENVQDAIEELPGSIQTRALTFTNTVRHTGLTRFVDGQIQLAGSAQISYTDADGNSVERDFITAFSVSDARPLTNGFVWAADSEELPADLNERSRRAAWRAELGLARIYKDFVFPRPHQGMHMFGLDVYMPVGTNLLIRVFHRSVGVGDGPNAQFTQIYEKLYPGPLVTDVVAGSPVDGIISNVGAGLALEPMPHSPGFLGSVYRIYLGTGSATGVEWRAFYAGARIAGMV